MTLAVGDVERRNDPLDRDRGKHKGAIVGGLVRPGVGAKVQCEMRFRADLAGRAFDGGVVGRWTPGTRFRLGDYDDDLPLLNGCGPWKLHLLCDGREPM